MPSRQSSNGRILNYTPPEKAVVYKLGLYGWRKKCLYFLIFMIGVISIINLALTIWIMRVQDFGLNGMGRLEITSKGLKMDGVAEFTKLLRAKNIIGRENSPIKINSRRNLTLTSFDEDGNVAGQILLDSNKIVLQNNQLHIKDKKGRTLLYADDKKIKLDMDNMQFTVPGGLKLEDSIQTSSVEAPDNQDLRLESLSKKLQIKASKDINMISYGANVKIGSLNDMKFTSKNGKVYFDADKIKFKNLPQSTIIGKSNIYADVAEVCICKDGTLFLAPPDSQLPCKVTNGICDGI